MGEEEDGDTYHHVGWSLFHHILLHGVGGEEDARVLICDG